jgi:hypothetical protein
LRAKPALVWGLSGPRAKARGNEKDLLVFCGLFFWVVLVLLIHGNYFSRMPLSALHSHQIQIIQTKPPGFAFPIIMRSGQNRAVRMICLCALFDKEHLFYI